MGIFLDILGVLALILVIPVVLWVWWRSTAPKHTAPGETAGDATRGELKAGRLFCGPGVPYGDEACPELTVSITRMIADSEETRDSFESLVREEANTRAAEQRIDTANADAQAIQAQADAIEQAGEGYVNLQLIELCRQHPDACPTLWVLPSGSDAPGINVGAP